MDALSWLSAVVLVLTVALAIDTVLGWRALGRLADVPVPGGALPPLTIVVAARNEAEALEAALRSMLALDYAPLEVVAIDDRSSDATGEILDRLAREFAALRVLHIRELPPGWLGKNHALHRGAQQAGGKYLLFTDADVHFEPSALARAVAHCDARGLEHLTLIPSLPSRSPFVAIAVLAGLVGLMSLYRPWRAARTGRHDTGIGAFNLVRADAYREAGGHAAIPMEVLDDIELGHLMGERRRQDALLAVGLVSVEMYRTPRELFAGIQKNTFTFLHYSPVWLVVATAAVLASTWPWVGVFVTEGTARWMNLGAVVATVAMHADVARRFGYGPLALAYLPLNGPITLALMWQVALRTWIRGGVEWRGTFYPLAEIRARSRSRGRWRPG